MDDRPLNIQKMTLPMPRSSTDDERHHEDDEHHHHEEVGDQLLLRRPDDLAQLGDDLPVEQDRTRALTCRRRRAHCVASATVFLVSARPTRWSALWGTALQGTRDLNPQPSVLETDALPVELVPFDPPARARPRRGHGKACGRTTRSRVYGQHRGGVQTGPVPAPGRRGRRLGRPPSHPYHGPMSDTASSSPRDAPGLRPDRRDRRVRDAQGRCEGQGAQGRGPARDRLRRRRARLPDPRRTSSRPRSTPAATPATTATRPPRASPSSSRRSPTRPAATAGTTCRPPRSW